MPILAGLMSTLFGGLVAFFGRFMLHKSALILATVTMHGGLIVALMSAQLTMISGIQASLPQNQYFLTGLWLAVPENGPYVVSACLAVDVLVAVYRWNKTNVKIVAAAGS